jgi:hypothetical protein
MIIVAKTSNGVLVKQLLNRVQLMDEAAAHNIPLADINQFSFLGQDRVFSHIKEMIHEKKQNNNLYDIDLPTYTYILDTLTEYN